MTFMVSSAAYNPSLRHDHEYECTLRQVLTIICGGPGMNHYTADYIKHLDSPPDPDNFNGNLETYKENKEGHSIGPETQSPWLRPNPPGFRKLIKWISDRYCRPIIYVTENGTSLKGENDKTREQILEDDFRAEYYRGYVNAMAEAFTFDNVDVRGYMAWSLME